jgi:hypothetical protein
VLAFVSENLICYREEQKSSRVHDLM